MLTLKRLAIAGAALALAVGLAGCLSLLGDMNLGAVDLTVHFPGRVLSTSGPGIQQTDDRTVRINTPLTTSNMNSTWTASSAIDPPKPASQRYLPIIIVAGVVMLGGGGGVLVLWRRHRRQPASATTTSPDE